MKVKISLTIDGNLLKRAKRHAANKNIGISELVETYFEQLADLKQQKNILELVDELEKPAINIPKKDWKRAFYEG